jgi:hypothetical protein
VWDRGRRDEIRAQLRVRKMGKRINERKKNSLKHLQRMPSETVPKQLLYYHPIGRRDPGRPRRRWPDGLMFEDETG